MGTEIVNERKMFAALNNCAFVSTKNIDKEYSKPFEFMMDMSMVGVGVGFDVKGSGKLRILRPSNEELKYSVPDTREGWVESLKLALNAFFKGNSFPTFDYSKIRKKGELIKGFGGVSSGYEPLKKLHNQIYNTFKDKEGLYITVTDITNIMNMIGICVVSGNVRRTAQIAFGEKDDTEYLKLKDYHWDKDGKIQGSNAERASYGWASNNSIFAELGMDYSDVAEQTSKNGEPGYIWLDNIRNYGRMGDLPDFADHRSEGTNPCLSYNTPLLTNHGFKKIGELEGKETYFIDSKGNTVKGEVWKTGLKDIIQLKYSTDRNFKEIKCTPNHKFLDIDGNETKAKDLKGKRIMPMFHEKQLSDMNISWVSLGFVQGDGRTNPASRQITVTARFNKNDNDIKKIFIAPTYKELEKLGFSKNKLPKRNLPSTFKEWELKNKLDFITGLYTANGSVLEKAKRVTLKTSNRTLAEEVSSFLLELGIRNYITTNKQHDVKFHNGVYTCKESYDVNIVGLYPLKIFSEKINFIQSYKREKLKKIILNSSPKIQSIKKIGKEEVYDFSLMSDNHWGVTQDHLIVHNCGEQSLESYEMCCLVETFPTKHESIEDYLRTLKFAYLYAKTVTLGNTTWAETNRVQLRNRRIGTSLSGIAQFIETRGIEELKSWLKQGYNTLKYYDDVYSDWLAIPKSIKLSTVKPSGTVSLLAGVTPGMHYPESNYYIRRIRISKNSSLLKEIINSGYKVEEDKNDSENTMVVEFPVEIPNVRSISQVSMWEQLSIAAFLQKYWSDNQVSSTITFKEHEKNDIKNALNYFQYQLKSISFLPKIEKGAYPQMPYEEITKEQYEKEISNIKNIYLKDTKEEAIPEKYCDTEHCEL
ncbi:MAG: LAGLIDADG family homing endonuclease [Bacillota bacterium]